MENKKENKSKLNKYQVASKLGNIGKNIVLPAATLVVGIVGTVVFNKNINIKK